MLPNWERFQTTHVYQGPWKPLEPVQTMSATDGVPKNGGLDRHRALRRTDEVSGGIDGD